MALIIMAVPLKFVLLSLRSCARAAHFFPLHLRAAVCAVIKVSYRNLFIPSACTRARALFA